MKPFSRNLIIILLFPVFFLTHGINENFGLISVSDLGLLLLQYVVISALVYLSTILILKDANKAILASFILLGIYFFFGAFKDFIDQLFTPKKVLSYRWVLPLLILTVVLLLLTLKRSRLEFLRTSRFISVLLFIFVFIEAIIFIKNCLSNTKKIQDFADYNNSLADSLINDNINKDRPDIFWIVFDEYASSESLLRNWQFINPIDSILSSKGFYVAKEATSNYNYTHYSLTSTLDMQYIPSLHNHSVVRMRDLVRGNYSLYENNVCLFLKKIGYRLENFSIYSIKGTSHKGLNKFQNLPADLINFQTLIRRTSNDIGWNWDLIFKKDKKKADSAQRMELAKGFDVLYKGLNQRIYEDIRKSAAGYQPHFFIIHFMLPHEPFIYNSDGSITNKYLFSMNKQAYLEQLQFTNQLIENLTDSIVISRRNRPYSIIMQGDHGYKFDEHESAFSSESCKILYAVYNSQRNYRGWYSHLSSVNGFRILFNNIFHSRLEFLPDSSCNLFYR